MASALETALVGLHATLRETAGVAGKYRRGVQDCDCMFVPGQTVSDEYGNDGAVATARLHDWKVKAGELVINGVEIEPAIGDLVVLADGRTFVVVYAAGEKCWRWSDYTRTAMRIHTVEQAKATV